MATADLSAQFVRDLLSYNPESGSLVWRDRPPELFLQRKQDCAVWNRRYAGAAAGSVGANGYLQVKIAKRLYYAHRLVWLHAHGCWPSEFIDHINGDALDNRIENLRDVPRRVNNENQRHGKNGRHLPLGVNLMRAKLSKPYFSRIVVAGEAKHLGYFATPEEAHAAYLDAKRLYHEGCTI